MSETWQKILAQGFSTATELLDYLGLPASVASDAAERSFRTRVPKGFAARMTPGDPADPLLLQVLATGREVEAQDGFGADPLCEQQANPLPGLIHKYHGRVLLTFSGACAVHCRYCFRRHFPYQANNPGRAGWREVLDYIAAHPEITEVILSGGDPLTATNQALQAFMEPLAAIPHVQTLRFHTRIPVVLPERVDDGLLTLLTDTRLSCVVVLHANHDRELDAQVEAACHRLHASGCLLLNQSVLLAGINDQADTLAALSERLFAIRVLPYYLHVLDRVRGAAHFDVPHETALSLWRTLQTRLPGYLLPRLAREEAGVAHKTLFV